MSVVEQQMPFYMRLRRQIGWLLLVKLIALIVIYYAFFSASHKTRITPQLLNQHLLNLDGKKAVMTEPERKLP